MSPHMAPKVGFEPTTYRLTAGCSTFELLRNNNWLWPTLPRPFGLSTISDEELNFCVRYGNRCILFSIITILSFSYFKLRPSSLDFVSILSHIFIYAPSYFTRLPRITRFKCENFFIWLYIVQSKLHIICFQIVRLSPRPISTSQLHALLHFHSLPIYHLFLMGSYYLRMGYLILRLASCLDAFSTYLNRT